MREVWKTIPDAEGYEASNLGRIRSWLKWKRDPKVPRILKPAPDKHGVLQVVLMRDKKGKTEAVCRLVLYAFRGIPENRKLMCRHRNGKPSDNNLSNLRWGTSKQNQNDRIRHGTSNRGIQNGRGKLSEKDVRFIRLKLQQGLSQSVLARQFKIHQSAVCNIAQGRNWGWLK